ncbi:bifunctional UDP-sugar hydrolase/5'-nucleotidase (plasmid) [Sporosarcina psychrophila]|uniref:bifunctional metallophosphatase/5'-nucleotidase n=1 Tax=Sporosarcina psychrophila TaxID=1476 RepID=UPI0030CE1A5C
MKFTLIQQNDTHGCLELHDELFWDSKGPILKKVGGYSRICKYVKDVKKENENVLFFDGGDLFHGTLPLLESKGNAILSLLKKMPLDGFVPGNWDFAYGKEQLQSLTSNLSFPSIACNLKDQDTGEPLLKPYIVKEMQGMKIGVIGLTYPYVDITMPPSFSEGMIFSTGVEEVQEYVEKLKDEVDIVVLLSHMGLPLDAKLVSLVNGIDIVLSGHSHDRVIKPIILNDTYIVQAGSSASFLGRLDITFEDDKVTDVQYELITVDEKFEEDEEVKEMVNSILAQYETERSTIVGETKAILHRSTLQESPMDKLITDAYLSTCDCDVAFSHGWRYGPPMAVGPLTLYDLHTIIPSNPKLFTLELDGTALLKALENNLEQVFSSEPFDQKGGYILRSSGLMMTYKPYNPKGNRIQSLQIAGENIDLNKIYKIVGGGGQLFKMHEKKKAYQNIQAIDLICSYLKEKKPYDVKVGMDILSV